MRLKSWAIPAHLAWSIAMLVMLTQLRRAESRDVLPLQFVHHNNTAMDAILDSLSEKFPNITRLYTIGSSYQGKKLRVLEITKHPGKHIPGKPEFKYIANMHGNEVVGRELLLLLAEHLCEAYGKMPGITQLLDTTRIHLLPSMNPDGYDSSKEGDCTSVVGRFNANGVDLNRNFPDPYERRDNPVQPEVQAVMNWLKREPFVLSANLHGGTLVANYPYDNIPPELKRSTVRVYYGSPDDDIFVKIAKAYSLQHATMAKGDPECPFNRAKHFNDGITNGAAWYPISGGMQDYNYYHSNSFEITLELGCCKFPPTRYVKDYWYANRKALLHYINLVHTAGMRGFVNDQDGNPVEGAKIIVDDRTKKVTSFHDGDYWRFLVPGTYSVKAKKRGYKNAVKTVTVEDGSSSLVNFTLVKKTRDNRKRAASVIGRFRSSNANSDRLQFSAEDSGVETDQNTNSAGRFGINTCILALLCVLTWALS